MDRFETEIATALQPLRIGGFRHDLADGMLALQAESGWCPTVAAEARIAAEIDAFFRAFDPICDFVMGGFDEVAPRAAIAVDGRKRRGGVATLRWFGVSRARPDRVAVARVMMVNALTFCRERGFGLAELERPRLDAELGALAAELGFRATDGNIHAPLYSDARIATLRPA